MIERIFTSHWRSPLLADVSATIIGVSRGAPRRSPGYPYRMLRSLAPSDETWTLKDLGEFEASYVRQLEALGAEKILTDLERIGSGRPCVCLCWERPHEPYCHRWTLSRFLEDRTGVVVEELRPGMLPERPDVPAPRLF